MNKTLKGMMRASLILLVLVIVSCGDNTPEFTTGTGATVSMTKTTVTEVTDGSGTIDLTFTFSSALSSEPTVTVVLASDDSAATGTCSFNDYLTIYTCSYTGLKGCATMGGGDYNVTLSTSALTEDFTSRFNAADDEFGWVNQKTTDDMIDDIDEVETTPSKCWLQYGGTSPSVNLEVTSEGTMKFIVPVGSTAINLQKTPGSDTGFAMSSLISTNEPPSGSKAANQIFNIGDQSQVFLTAGFSQGSDNWARQSFTVLEGQPVSAAPAGDLSDTKPQIAPFWGCMVRYDAGGGSYKVKTFVAFSEDGPWTELTTSNLVCAGKECTNVQTDILDQTTDYDAGSGGYIAKMMAATSETTTVYEPEIDYVRFNTTDITGTTENCPALP